MSPFSVLCICLLFAAESLAQFNKGLLPDHRIIGGEEVDISSHPHQLTLLISRNVERRTGAGIYKDSVVFVHNCGGSIISRKWAITAAHCVGADPHNYLLGTGSSHRYNGTYHKISRIITHPQYNTVTVDCDIALIEIEGEFTYGENVQPIKLADRELEHGELVNVTGWGLISVEGSESDLLMKLTVPILKRETCVDAYKNFSYHVTEQMICTGRLGEGGKGACNGDSGGPLSANGTLYGTVSWTRRCAAPTDPVVYANVAKLRPWITSITGI